MEKGGKVKIKSASSYWLRYETCWDCVTPHIKKIAESASVNSTPNTLFTNGGNLKKKIKRIMPTKKIPWISPSLEQNNSRNERENARNMHSETCAKNCSFSKQ